jgi:hypothetical protein
MRPGTRPWRSGQTRSAARIPLLLLLGVAACVSDAPLSPGDPAVPRTPSPSVTLPSGNSFVIPYWPTSLMNQTEPIYVETGISVPPGMAAHMRFTGKLTATPKPACQPLWPELPWTPAVPWPTLDLYVGGVPRYDVGNVQGDRVVWFAGPKLGGGSEWPRGWAPFPWDPESNEPVTALDSAVDVWQPDAPGWDGSNPEITFRRDPFYSSCDVGPDPLHYERMETYTISGSQQVEVEFVAVEVTTAPSATTAAASTATASAAITTSSSTTTPTLQSGEPITYQASSVNFTPDNDYLYWIYTPDANPYAATNVEACNGHSTCTYVAPGPGRMAAGIPLSRFYIWGYSAHVEQGPERNVVVVCEPDPVVRGQDVTCTARLNTGEDWSYISAFTTELGTDPDDPGAQAEPDMTPTPDGKGQFTTGKAVFSSTVAVTGQFGGPLGPLVSGSGSFKVKNRPGFPAPVLPAPKQAPEYTLVSPNFPPTALGGYVGPAIDFTPKTGPALPYQPVDAGPNRGYSYLTAPPAFKKPIILLHFSMIGQGDWFLEQNGVDHGEHTAANGLPYCNYEGITDRLDADVRRHEAGPVKSHHTIWREIFQQQRTISFFDRYSFRTELGEKHGRNKLENKWSKFKTRPDVQAAHDLWDNEDNGANYEHVQEHIQCAFDNNRGD